jgi:hypothetical protein
MVWQSCSASVSLTVGTTSIASGTGGYLLYVQSGNVLGNTAAGSGVLTALGNALNGSGGLQGTVSFGSGAQTALSNPTNAANGFPVQSGAITTGDCLKWGPGISDAGSCGGGTPASGFVHTATTGWTGSNSAIEMVGLAGAITPATTGSVLFNFTGIVSPGSNVGYTLTCSIYYGTGSAPAANASVPGSAVALGTTTAWTGSSANIPQTATITGLATGLSISTTYWIDLGCQKSVSLSMPIGQVNLTAMEN